MGSFSEGKVMVTTDKDLKENTKLVSLKMDNTSTAYFLEVEDFPVALLLLEKDNCECDVSV